MSKGKLLLADDSVTIQKVVNLTFADEGIEVLTAGNGDAAMEMIAAERPDIVLADVNMPGLNGYQLCERLRGAEETRNIPLMLLVGSFEPFDDREAKRVGASGFMTKPFQSIKLLVSQVSELLDATGRLSDEVSSGRNAEPEEPQTDDIEELYNSSLTKEAGSVPGVSSGVDALGDAGMDDEIIETILVSADVGQQAVSPFEERVSDETQSSQFEPGLVSGAERFFDEVPPIEEQKSDAASVVSETNGIDNTNTMRFEATAAPKVETEYKNTGPNEDDLLELPDFGYRSGPASQSPTSRPAAGGSVQITSLSPELIDLIVQKVIEKMAEKP